MIDIKKVRELKKHIVSKMDDSDNQRMIYLTHLYRFT